MAAMNNEFDDFFNLNDPSDQFEFMDLSYLHSGTTPGELRALVDELIH